MTDRNVENSLKMQINDIVQTTKKYKSGMRHIHCQLPFLKTFYLGLYINTGSADELLPEEWGIAHYLEHMIFRGSVKFPDHQETRRQIAQLGVTQNAYTYFNTMHFYMVMPHDSFLPAFDVLLDRTFNPLLTEEATERERGVMIEERRLRDIKPEALLDDAVMKQLTKGSGYAHPIAGVEKSLSSISYEAIRNFYTRTFLPESMTLITYSADPVEELREDIDEKLETLPILPSQKQEPEKRFGTASSTEDFPIKLASEVDTPIYLTHMLLPVIRSKDDYVATLFMYTYLSLGRLSLINTELVHKGLISDNFRSEMYPYKNFTSYTFSASLSLAHKDKFQAKVSEVFETITRVGIPEDQFERIKGTLLGKLTRLFEEYDYPKIRDIDGILHLNALLDHQFMIVDIFEEIKQTQYKSLNSNLLDLLKGADFAEGWSNRGVS